MSKQIVPTLALLGALVCAQAQAAVILQLDPPDGAVSGTPGATVGWGFSLSSDTDFLVVSGASFTAPAVFGSFTDYISASFFVVGPPPENSPLSQAFDPALMTGIGAFTLDPGAVAGRVGRGQIVLTYDLFSVSPNDINFDPDTDTLSTGNTVSADASVAVVPEPASLLLFATGLAGWVGWGNPNRRQRGKAVIGPGSKTADFG